MWPSAEIVALFVTSCETYIVAGVPVFWLISIVPASFSTLPFTVITDPDLAEITEP